MPSTRRVLPLGYKRMEKAGETVVNMNYDGKTVFMLSFRR